MNDTEEAATILEGAGCFRAHMPSAQQEGMGYHSGNGRGCIRLFNTSAIAQEYSRWEMSEQVTARVALATGIKDTHATDNKQSMHGFGNCWPVIGIMHFPVRWNPLYYIKRCQNYQGT